RDDIHQPRGRGQPVGDGRLLPPGGDLHPGARQRADDEHDVEGDDHPARAGAAAAHPATVPTPYQIWAARATMTAATKAATARTNELHREGSPRAQTHPSAGSSSTVTR